MSAHPLRLALLVTAALALAPSDSVAKTVEELSARVEQLEGALDGMRDEVDALRAALAESDRASAAEQAARAAAAAQPQAAPPAAAVTPEGFRVGDTTIRLGGFITAETLVSDYSDGTLPSASAGRDFYVPATITVGGIDETTAFSRAAPGIQGVRR